MPLRSTFRSGLLTVASLAVARAASVDGVMRKDRAWHNRQDAIEIDGKAHLKDEPRAPLQPKGPLPPLPPPKPTLYEPPSELSLAYLSDAVYGFETPVAGWDLKAQVEHPGYWMRAGVAHAGLYAKTKGEEGHQTTQCAVVFSVQFDHYDTVANWTTHEDSKKTQDLKQCKIYDVHKGMLEELESLILEPAWEHEIEMFAAHNCDEILTGGHSLGGALASIFAACANGANGELSFPPLFRDGVVVKQGQKRSLANVTGLYTFGAPAVSKTQLTNRFSEDNTFAGGRFYNEDKLFFDVVPFEGGAIGLKHPKVAAIRLEEPTSGWVHRKEYEAGSRDALREPDFLRVPSLREHEMGTYLERVHRAPLKTGLTEPGMIARAPLITGKPEPHTNRSRLADESAGFHARLVNTSYADDSFAIPKKGYVARVGGKNESTDRDLEVKNSAQSLRSLGLAMAGALCILKSLSSHA